MAFPTAGSSPHTRGLLVDDGGDDSGGGIIPAHAGFTPNPSGTWEWPPDHPRTRGVYSSRSSSQRRWAGSSPHTRGLRVGGPLRGAVSGIIPAHAGFTQQFPRRPRGWMDHPRTRGVYACVVGVLRWAVWIIPARAGFTYSERDSERGVADHPRTRGVYGENRDRWYRNCGSSPHARGLPCRWCEVRFQSLDHPRTRGVYKKDYPHGFKVKGSSPHARGLPAARVAVFDRPGIIPARAGFTRCRRCGRSRCSDHPRTRGVYTREVTRSAAVCGSSPHARGLRATW